ncbi:MAG TPA: hypothetical protein VF032_19465 [Thermoleophilaceae bacterium]
MANLPLAFGELLAGGVLLTAGISGSSPADVLAGNVSLKRFDAGGSAATAPAAAGAGGANPFAHAKGYKLGRTDMGVDATMKPGSRIDAPFPSKLVGITPNWYRGQPGMFFQITSGPHKGKFWFLAEQIVPGLKVGNSVAAGQQVATYAGQGTGIEIGWAANSSQTLAQGTTGYVEGQVTKAGQSFLDFLHSVGA